MSMRGGEEILRSRAGDVQADEVERRSLRKSTWRWIAEKAPDFA
jgi:cAMP phosphodiesterase